jgi:hypothetical protein
MDVQQAREIIRDKGLGPYVMFEDKVLADAIVVRRDTGGWCTYATSERAGVDGTVSRFESESDALDDFVDRLRAQRLEQEYVAKKRAERRAARQAEEG